MRTVRVKTQADSQVNDEKDPNDHHAQLNSMSCGKQFGPGQSPKK
jgi:hypothetical protein